MKNILKILPEMLAVKLRVKTNLEEITEIRLRNGKNIYVRYGIDEVQIDYIVKTEDFNTILKNVSSNSIYTIQDEMNNGYFVVPGGHRIGITGEVICYMGQIKNVKSISSMNIRVAKEYIGIADKVIDKIICNKEVNNTVIISPPLCGKTTLLRDILREVSNSGYNVTLIDERGEIACMREGISTLDIGKRTDVISYISKAIGMNMALRSMAPDVIFTDELGSMEDINAIKKICISGVKFVTTIHGSSLKDIKQNKGISELIELRLHRLCDSTFKQMWNRYD